MPETTNSSIDLQPVEPGLRACVPITRLTHSDNRCIIAYYLQSPISDDGKQLLYFEFDRPYVDQRKPEPIRGWVTMADADGSNIRRLEKIDVPSPSSGAQQQWCGSMNRVVFFEGPDENRMRWHVVDLDSGSRWRGNRTMRHVSPDGRELSFQMQNPADFDHVTSHDDVAADFYDYENDRETLRVTAADLLAKLPGGEKLGHLHWGVKKPLFSPDGKHLAFVFSNQPYRSYTDDSEPRHHHIFMSDRDGSNLRYVTPFQTHPSWHPDSSHYCALCKQPETGELAFGLFPVGEGEPQYWSHESLRSGHPSIQPVHQKYVINDQFDKQRNVAQLWLYRTDNWEAKLLLEAEYDDYSNNSGTHLHPAWAPDGNSLYINSAHPGPAQVYRVDVM